LNCPFCQNPVLPNAYVCGHCGRDLVPWLSLLGQLEHQAQRIARLEKATGLPPLTAGQAISNPDAALPDLPEPPPVRYRIGRLVKVALGTALGLCMAHWLLLFIYDAPALILRVSTMLLPLGLSLAANIKGDIDWRSNLVTAIALSLLGVGGMLAITATLDDVRWLPQSKREWIETFEYAVAIGLAWVTGHLVGLSLNKGHRLLYARRQAALRQGRMILPKVTDMSEKLQKLAAAAAPLVSGLVAAYSGLKSLWGEP
jgi:hypothetical protein